MAEKNAANVVGNRRQFLSRVSAAAAASGMAWPAASRAGLPGRDPAPLLPTIPVGAHRITRLVAGWNPIGGNSYMGPNMSEHMRQYFTDDRIVDYLSRCEAAGINAHQFSRPERMAAPLRRLRQGGSKMKFICLHAGGPQRMPVDQVVRTTAPIAIVHHGGVTDRLFRDGKAGQVCDFLKRVHDAGVLAGVSAHNPDCIKQVADEGWEADLFMACFYYYTRTEEELKQMPEVVTVQLGKPFFASDPLRMTAVMRQVDQPCLGFKILAAGRLAYHRHSVREAFKFAFEHIKPTDGVIVGMYPRFHDEIADNARYTRQFGPARPA